MIKSFKTLKKNAEGRLGISPQKFEEYGEARILVFTNSRLMFQSFCTVSVSALCCVLPYSSVSKIHPCTELSGCTQERFH